jgi:predicted RNase H-like HicB family nuclease
MPSYIGLIRKDADSDFGVSLPDFPGAITAGKTLEALALHVEGSTEDGQVFPEPSTLEEVMSEPDNRT